RGGGRGRGGGRRRRRLRAGDPAGRRGHGADLGDQRPGDAGGAGPAQARGPGHPRDAAVRGAQGPVQGRAGAGGRRRRRRPLRLLQEVRRARRRLHRAARSAGGAQPGPAGGAAGTRPRSASSTSCRWSLNGATERMSATSWPTKQGRGRGSWKNRKLERRRSTKTSSFSDDDNPLLYVPPCCVQSVASLMPFLLHHVTKTFYVLLLYHRPCLGESKTAS
ncbi:unnamed protein product, partial [Heterosigma akashiwo]